MAQTDQKKLPARHSPVGRALFLGLVILLVSAALFLVVWKWDTIGFIFVPERIQIKGKAEILPLLQREGYSVYHQTEDELSYLVLDDAIDVQLRFAEDKLASMHIAFNLYDISIQTASEAAHSADLLLSPYFSQPEIEAVIVILSSDLSVFASDNAIHCTLPLAGYSLRIDGDQKYGEVDISLT